MGREFPGGLIDASMSAAVGSGQKPAPDTPTISVGVPVYNGKDYLPELMHSLLNQTFTDIEIVICDNASTDRTPQICAEFARRDPRVRYFRNERNIGPLNNYNRVFHLSRGKYFCWMAHDDFLDPTDLEKRLRVLEQNDDVVHCVSDVVYIGPDSRPLPYDPVRKRHICGPDGQVVPVFPRHVAAQRDPVARFADLLARSDGVYESGLVRREMMAKTSLQKDFYGNGVIWQMELALKGRFVMLEDKLFYRRFHPKASFFVPADRKDDWVAQGAQGATRRRLIRFTRFTRSYFDVIRQATTLTWWQRLQCYGHVLRHTVAWIIRKVAERGAAVIKKHRNG